jgi:hypothetical protein
MTVNSHNTPQDAAAKTVLVAAGAAPHKGDAPDKAHLLASTFVSLLVCLPAIAFTAYMLDGHVALEEPQILMLLIMALGIADFAALVTLDGYRRRLGPLTLPALAGSAGLVLLYMMMQGINRFSEDFGYAWLYPLALAGLVVSYLAIFGEKTAVMKVFLCVNGLALSVLTCLGHADKIILPF